MTEKSTRAEATTTAAPLTDDELKLLAEAMSDGGRKLLSRLAERHETGIDQMTDRVALQELADGEFIILVGGLHAKLTELGRQLAEYLGTYVPAPPVDPPVLQAAKADDAEKRQEAIRKETEAAHADADKAEKAREKEGAKG